MILLCLADIHGATEGLQRVVEEAADAEAVIIAGDVTHLGGYGEAEKVLGPVWESKKRVLAVAGNMDKEGVGRYLRERGIDIHGRGVTLGSFGIQGLGGSNHSPFGTPFEIEDQEARALLESGFSDITQCEWKILVSHAPPKDTGLDRTMTGRHVGSRVVRDFIASKQPVLCISGHIHESPGEDAIGGTLCVNVGPYKSGSYALVRIEGGKAAVNWRKR